MTKGELTEDQKTNLRAYMRLHVLNKNHKPTWVAWIKGIYVLSFLCRYIQPEKHYTAVEMLDILLKARASPPH